MIDLIYWGDVEKIPMDLISEKNIISIPIQVEKPLVSTIREGVGISWEQLIKRCPKCNAIFSITDKTNCPFCGQVL